MHCCYQMKDLTSAQVSFAAGPIWNPSWCQTIDCNAGYVALQPVQDTHDDIRIFCQDQDSGRPQREGRQVSSLESAHIDVPVGWQGPMLQTFLHSSCQPPVSAPLKNLSFSVRRQRPFPPGRHVSSHRERAVRARAAAAPRKFSRKGADPAPAGPRSWQQTSKSQKKKSSSGSSSGKPDVKKGGTIRTGAEQSQDDHHQRLSKVIRAERISNRISAAPGFCKAVMSEKE